MEKPSERLKLALLALNLAERPDSPVKHSRHDFHGIIEGGVHHVVKTARLTTTSEDDNWKYVETKLPPLKTPCANFAGLAAIMKFNLTNLGGCSTWQVAKDNCQTDLNELFYNEIMPYEISLSSGSKGDVGMMFKKMNLDPEVGKTFDRAIVSYWINIEQFKRDIQKLIGDLEKAGY